MSTIVTRAGKGSALTHNEVDANFVNLNTDKLQSGDTAAALTITSATINGGTITGTALNGTLGATTPSTVAATTISASGVSTFSAGSAGAPAITTTGDTNTGIFFPAADTIAFAEGGTESMRIDSNGNVGIGLTAPVTNLNVDTFYSFNSTKNGAIRINDQAAGANYGMLELITPGFGIYESSTYGGSGLRIPSLTAASGIAQSSGNITFYTNSGLTAGTGFSPTERMRLDSSGNLGLGVTPASWGSAIKALQINNTSSIFADTAINIANNLRQNSGNFYINTGFATDYAQTTTGQHQWFIAPSGTAGNAISFTQAMTLDNSGRLGIGTTSPAYNLTIGGGTGSQAQALIGGSAGASTLRLDLSGTGTLTTGFNNSGSTVNNLPTGVAGMWMQQAYPLIFGTNAAERMRIDSSGNLGLGVTPSAWDTNRKVLQIGGSGALWTGSSGAGTLFSSNNAYFDGTNFRYLNTSGSTFFAQLTDGSFSWNRASSGTAGTAITFTQAMTLDANGGLVLGSTDAGYLGNNTGIWIRGGIPTLEASRNSNHAAAFARLGTDGAVVNFLKAASVVGSISVTASATSYVTSSDYRLKENVAPMTGALATVQALKPVTYNWKIDGSASQGFIAHELAEVVPDCVTGEKDAVDEEGNPVYQGIDTSFLVATLTAAIQEQQAMIDELKAKVAALEIK